MTTVLILRTLLKHSKIMAIPDKHRIIEIKILKPVKILNISGRHSTDIAIFMSSLAVRFLENIIIHARYVIPIGEDTEQEILKNRNIVYSRLLKPSHYSSIGIVRLLENIARLNSSIRNVHVYRSAHGNDMIASKCRELNLSIREYRIYKLEPINHMLSLLPGILEKVDIVIAMSGLILETVYRYLTDIGKTYLLKNKYIIVPGPEAASKARKLGIENLYVAENSKISDILRTVESIVRT
ncbi:MAG: hypothetical protein GXO10_02675 [Crenarchaeota archaeon]|nr:hypothetical protein [Thermoproteota archaeon]